jgi:hypothetical protein
LRVALMASLNMAGGAVSRVFQSRRIPLASHLSRMTGDLFFCKPLTLFVDGVGL